MDRHRMDARQGLRRLNRARLLQSVSGREERLALEALEDRRMLAPVAELLKDINLVTEGSYPGQFTVFEERAYFTASEELWSTDGTPTGTYRLGDLTGIRALAVWHDALWFTRADNGLQLWKTDGTEVGTELVVATDSAASSGGLMFGATRGLYFAAWNSETGSELWTSDGTAAGTRLVKDIYPGTRSSEIRNFAEIAGTLYLVANDGTNGYQLWKSDGSESGTAMVRNLGVSSTAPSKPIEMNGQAYFTAAGRLWKSDGTAAGTVDLLRSSSTETTMVTLNGRLLFSGIDPLTSDVGLWTTDGTDGLTYLVKDTYVGGSAVLSDFTVIGGLLYFISRSSEIWRSDGTESGTFQVGRLPSGGAQPVSPRIWAKYGEDLLVTGTLGSVGSELWLADANSTTLLKDIAAGSTYSRPEFQVSLGGRILFTADDALHGEEVWVTDGTEAGTLLLRDINTAPEDDDSEPQMFTQVGDITYFVARDNAHGFELWKTDGTEAGTQLVKDISPGLNGTEFYSLHDVQGRLFFLRQNWDAPEDEPEGPEVWVSDGTEAGTQLVVRLPPIDSGDGVEAALVVGSLLFFTFDDGDHGSELWKTDGTAEGTGLVKNIRSGWFSSSPSNFVELNEQLYFTADDGTGADLWRSDGTESGTVLVKRLEPEFSYTQIYNMTRAGGRLFFTMDDDRWRHSLWTSDGTADGTTKLYELLRYGTRIFDEAPFVPLGEKIIYAGPDPDHNWGLMVSDGTLAGTKLLSDSNGYLVEVNGRVFFGGDEDVGGELWETDGTPEGTRPAVDLTPLSDGDSVYPFANVNGTLLFQTRDYYVWASDGTIEGTQAIAYDWGDLTSFGDLTYFSVSDRTVGNEPFVLRNLTALVDLNGADGGRAFVTAWRGVPVPIVAPEATIDSSQDNLTALVVRLNAAQSGAQFLFDLSGSTIRAAFDGTTLTLSGVDSRANYERVLRSLRFHATGEIARSHSVVLDVQAFTADGFAVVPVQTTIELAPVVVGRHLFYNHSHFDDQDAAATAADDGALAPDKIAYLPGSGPASVASVSSYVQGINGVMIDVAGLPGGISAADFQFRVGTSNAPESWIAAPDPLEVIVRPGQGTLGSDRVSITWADGAIKNTWLQIVVRGNDALGGFHTQTGLTSSDVFYFGSRVGDSFAGALPRATSTSLQDELLARNHPAIDQAATNPLDFNRDGLVSLADQLIARNNSGVLMMIEIDAFSELASSAEAATTLTRAVRPQAALVFALALEQLEGEDPDEPVARWFGRPGRGRR